MAGKQKRTVIVGMCVVDDRSVPVAYVAGEERARLIAAAPDLLAACKALLAHPDMKASPKAICDARAAIAKAEGR